MYVSWEQVRGAIQGIGAAMKNSISKVRGLADAAQEAADTAKTTADSAVTAAGKAQTAADNAQTTADSAVTAAGKAQTAADNAQTTADSAVTAAGKAQTAADNAQTTADSAVTAAGKAQSTADAAKTTATNAQTTANTAKTTADAAKTTATNAQNTANTAQSTAVNATKTANTATSVATNAQTLASKAQLSADEAKAEIVTTTNALDSKMNRSNPVGIGHFSLNRYGPAGAYSFAVGESAVATGRASFAANGGAGVHSATVTGDAGSTEYVCSSEYAIPGRVIRYYNYAISPLVDKCVKIEAVSITENNERIITVSETLSSSALENANIHIYIGCAIGEYSFSAGVGTAAIGRGSFSDGFQTEAHGNYSMATGSCTIATRSNQVVHGYYNVIDEEEIYLFIIGNGTKNDARKNAYTLDRGGNAWHAGSVECTELILKSNTHGSTKRFKITVNDSGTLTATEIT